MDDLKTKLAKGFFWSSLDFISSQGIQLLIQVILARLLFPKDFGLIGMITIFIAVSNWLVDCGFSQALIREKNCSQKDYSTIFYFNLIMSCVTYLIIYFIAPFVSAFFKSPEIKLILQIISLVIIINAFGLIQRTILIKKINFKALTKINMISSISSGFIAVSFAYIGLGVWSLVIRTLVMQFFVTSMLFFTVKWKPSFDFCWISFKKLIRFSSKILIAGLLNTIYENIYFVIIGRIYNTSELGYFSNSKKLSDISFQFVSLPVQRVSYPVFSNLKEDEKKLKNNFIKTIKLSAYVNFFIMVFLLAASDNIIPLIFGDKWIPSIPFFKILCVAGMLHPIHLINLNILQVKGRSDLFLKLEILKKIFFTILIIIILLLKLNIYYLIWAYAVNSFVSLYINTIYSKNIIQFSFKEQIIGILPFFIVSIIMGLLVYFLGIIIPFEIHYKIFLQIIIGIGIYYIFSKLLKFEELNILIRNIKKVIRK